jgi:hypothetical protein
MLRLWTTGHGDERIWRITLEDAHSGERQAFANLESLFRYLDTIDKDTVDKQRGDDGSAAPERNGA